MKFWKTSGNRRIKAFLALRETQQCPVTFNDLRTYFRLFNDAVCTWNYTALKDIVNSSGELERVQKEMVLT
jgi:hypothetical protein